MNCNNAVYRGDTITYTFNFCVPVTDAKVMKIIFKQKDQIILEKYKTDTTAIEIVDEDTIKVRLTQEETLLFSAKYPLYAQIRAVCGVNNAVIASDWIELSIGDLLKNEVI